MSNMITFKKGSRQKLTKNFRRCEMDCNCSIWHETIIDMDLVEGVQQIRDFFGKPANSNSAYRCEYYNSNMKPRGSKTSEHMKGKAVDLAIKGVDPRLVAAKAKELGFRVGFYTTFTHIDTSGRPDFIGKY